MPLLESHTSILRNIGLYVIRPLFIVKYHITCDVFNTAKKTMGVFHVYFFDPRKDATIPDLAAMAEIGELELRRVQILVLHAPSLIHEELFKVSRWALCMKYLSLLSLFRHFSFL